MFGQPLFIHLFWVLALLRFRTPPPPPHSQPESPHQRRCRDFALQRHSAWARSVKVHSALYSCDSRWKLHLVNICASAGGPTLPISIPCFFSELHMCYNKDGEAKSGTWWEQRVERVTSTSQCRKHTFFIHTHTHTLTAASCKAFVTTLPHSLWLHELRHSLKLSVPVVLGNR